MTVEMLPTYADIIARSEQLAGRCPELIAYRQIGPSEEKRPIPMLTIGDPDRDLPLLMVTGGMHGSEETGRAIALALAEWFAGDGRAFTEKMSAVIMPCGNPDGTVRDTRANAAGVDLCRAFHYRKEPEPVEAAAINTVMFDLLPDCFIDCHGLAGGGMCDYEFLYANLPANMSTQVGFLLAAEMDAEANRLGYPTSTPRLWGIYEGEGDTPCFKMGCETNALVMVVETTENYYPLADSVRSGMARLKKLVEIGTRTHFCQPYPGFPCDALVGGPAATLMPFGATYRKRRESRLALMHAVKEDFCTFTRATADKGNRADLCLTLGPKTASFPAGIVAQAGLDPRLKVTSVRYEWPDGSSEVLGEDPEHGYVLWVQDDIPRVRVSVAKPPLAGDNHIIIEYDKPF